MCCAYSCNRNPCIYNAANHEQCRFWCGRRSDILDKSYNYNNIAILKHQGLRKYTLLPLDDCLYALQATIPHLSRSSLHRCYQRHGISRLPDVDGDKPKKKKFKKYPIGSFHIDIAEVRTEEGKLYLFVAIDRTSKFAYVELHERQTKMIAAEFLCNLVAAVPYKLTHILTDNGIQFTNRKCDKHAFVHIFERVCAENGIKHRLTKVKHPWTNGQVERMNRTIKEATVKRYYYGSHAQLKEHLHAFMMACNFAKRLKTLKALAPYEYICEIWKKEPERFNIDPFLYTVGLNKSVSLSWTWRKRGAQNQAIGQSKGG